MPDPSSTSSSISPTMPSPEKAHASKSSSPSSPLLTSTAGLKLKEALDNTASTPVSPSSLAAPQSLLPPGKDIVAQLIDFLSTASSPVLGAAAAGVVGILCVVFGRIGILAVGVALGALGHATLQDRSSRLDSVIKKSEDGDKSPVRKTPTFSFLSNENLKRSSEYSCFYHMSWGFMMITDI